MCIEVEAYLYMDVSMQPHGPQYVQRTYYYVSVPVCVCIHVCVFVRVFFMSQYV